MLLDFISVALVPAASALGLHLAGQLRSNGGLGALTGGNSQAVEAILKATLVIVGVDFVVQYVYPVDKRKVLSL
jgi:hypothetical protein